MTKGNKARDYTRTTIRRLDINSGNECACPDCSKKLVAEDGISIVAKICHIEAASPNGPRFNPESNDEYRRSYENLILLCDEHHTIIDNKNNEAKYPVELLKQWKTDHEKKILNLISGKNLLSKKPLALNKIINFISNNIEDFFDLPKAENAPNPEEKIKFNQLGIYYESIVRDFSVYQGKLNKIYEEIERQGSMKKESVLYSIKDTYLKVKIKYKTIDEIIANSDVIFGEVIERILDKIYNASNSLDDLDEETLLFSLNIIIVDAFMRCNILEEPPKV